MSEFAVQQYAAGDLPLDVAAQVESFVRIVWGAQAKGDARFWHLNTISDPTTHFVIVERGVLISHTLVRQRTLNHAGETFSLYGVGAVMTYPAFRGEGHGQRVVEAATAFIRASSADVGMLFTYADLETFYGNCGWVHLPDPGVHYGDPANPKFDDAFVMMLFLSDKGMAKRASFDRGPIYVGSSMW